MRFTIASDHFDFFATHGYIGFDGLFSNDRLEALEKHIVKDARDLWRIDPLIKEAVFEKTCAGIASELTKSKNVRIGYDQTLCTDEPLPFGMKTSTLADLSCIQPIVCGMLLRLTEGDMPPPSTPYCPCPERKGTALFFSAKMLINLSPLTTLHSQKFLLVAYAGPRPLYVAKEADPTMHALKKFGYAFGDHLNAETHPVLFSQR